MKFKIGDRVQYVPPKSLIHRLSEEYFGTVIAISPNDLDNLYTINWDTYAASSYPAENLSLITPKLLYTLPIPTIKDLII